MSTLWVGNFDAESEMAFDSVVESRSLFASSPQLEQLCFERAHLLWSATSPGDELYLPVPFEVEFQTALQALGWPALNFRDELPTRSKRKMLSPWCWTPNLLSQTNQPFEVHNIPTWNAVRTANSRRFSYEWEQAIDNERPVTLPIESLEDLQQHLNTIPAENRWVLKSEFGMSGREQFRGKGAKVSPQLVGWVKRRLKQTLFLVWEPWLENIAEGSFHLTILPLGQVKFAGFTELISDRNGQYRGNRVSHCPLSGKWSLALPAIMKLGAHLAQHGYVGPLGIDSMMYLNSAGEECLRLFQDINARFTMGRLTLCFRKFLSEAECYSWHHLRWPFQTRAEREEWWTRSLLSHVLPDCQLIRTSPWMFGTQPASQGSYLLLAPNDEQLRKCEIQLEQEIAKVIR